MKKAEQLTDLVGFQKMVKLLVRLTYKANFKNIN